MKILDMHSAAMELARAINKPILYIHIGDWQMENSSWVEEAFKAAPYLKDMFYGEFNHEVSQALVYGTMYIVCDSEEEMERLYRMTVGDDGPTDTNPYDGDMRIYALTINAQGETENENT